MSETPKPPQLAPMQQAILDIRSLRTRLEASELRQRAPVAIVGMACRFPGGADTLRSYWRLLSEGIDAVGEIPADRWDPSAWYDPNPDAPGKMSTRWGGFLRDVDRFDAEFFGISDREAVSIDPQHRLLLEVAFEALEDAGLPAQSLFGTSAGVFVGISSFDYGQLRGQTGDRSEMDAYHATGVAHSAASGRLAYYLGLQGPSLSIDTACSSSLVAVHLACQSLRAGECRAALAGGVNLILSPEIHIALSKARMMAPDGRCKAFDDRADGFVRSEGCGIVVLKLLNDALADGDRIHAVIRGSACNQDGRSSGLTAPNGPSQTAVLRAAWRAAGVQPGQLGYVETHGTGTALGDPIEAGALAAALEGAPGALPLGSVKTNLGHMEAAAGIGGLIKTALALENEELPPNLHFQTPSRNVVWDRLKVVREKTAWPRGSKPRLAGVSSFGFSGTNVHIVLEEAPPPAPAETRPERSCHLLTLSALGEPALREVAARYAAALRTGCSLADFAYTANAGRSHFPHRAAVVAASAEEAAAMLDALDEAPLGRADPLNPPEVVFTSGAPPPSERKTLEALARLYVQGARVDWKAVDRGWQRRLIDIPGYPWKRRRYWFPVIPRPTEDERWQAVLAAGDRQAAQAPLDLLLHTYPDKYRLLDRLATSYIVRAFQALGAVKNGLSASDLVDFHGVLPLYRNLMERWLRKLAGVQLPDSAVESLESEAIPLFADAPMLLDYVKGCGRLLAPILTGRTSPLDTLFPGGSLDLAEAIYHRAALSRYFNAIAGALAGAFAQGRDGPLRILEVGAGTGGTTASILPMLPADRTAYTFTDVSEFFSDHAARRFKDFGFLKFGLLDLERAPESQGYGAGQYDMVVAANVLHATKYLGQTLDFVRGLLRGGGVLLLYEVTDPPSYFDVSIALIEGWQKSADPNHDTGPLLSAGEWKKRLLQHGFQETASWPPAGSPAEALGSRVFAARATGCARVSPAPTPPVIPAREPAADRAEDILASLAEAPESEHAEMLTAFVRREVARVLRRAGQTEIPRDQPLMDLGLDSLMAVELRNNLGRSLQLAKGLPATLMFDYPTIADIAAFLLAQRAPLLDGLSDADVERLLKNKLEGMT